MLITWERDGLRIVLTTVSEHGHSVLSAADPERDAVARINIALAEAGRVALDALEAEHAAQVADRAVRRPTAE